MLILDFGACFHQETSARAVVLMMPEDDRLMASCNSLLFLAYLFRRIRKPTVCICENKGADQLCSNCTADQHLCLLHS